MAAIRVAQPRFWWRASSAHIRFLVPSDPDADDGSVRWADRGQQRWDHIARAVAQVGNELAAGRWVREDGSDDHGLVAIAGFPFPLTPTEQKIVRAWFSAGEAVRADPWSEDLGNGRHRLWGTLPHFGDSLIPVCGDALGYADAVNAAAIGPAWKQLAKENLRQLDATEDFIASDPLNAAFRAATAETAAGGFPPPL